MKPSLSRIGWTLPCCAAAAFALASTAQQPPPRHKDTQPLLPEVTDRRPERSPDAKSTNPKPPVTNPTNQTPRPVKPLTEDRGPAHSPEAKPPVTKKTGKVQRQFSQSADKLRAAKGRIQSALDAANAQLSKFPDRAAMLKPQIASLNQLLHEVNDLEMQAATVQEPVQASIRMGAEPGKFDTDAVQKKTKELVKLANIDADQADKIAENTNYSVTAQNAAPAAPAAPLPAAPATPPPAAPGTTPGTTPETIPPPAPGTTPETALPGTSSTAPGTTPGDEASGQPPVQATDPGEQWFKQLQNGLLHYAVPSSMNWKVASTITVTIDGDRASPTPLPDETGKAPIKVARVMTVQPSCPDNPDEFSFTPEPGTTPRQAVFADGTTTWQWSVVPKYTATNQKIKIQAWVVYSDKDNIERELPVYGAVVDVHVPGFWECVVRLAEGKADYWLTYGLPGGGGFIFVSGVFIALLKRRSTKK